MPARSRSLLKALVIFTALAFGAPLRAGEIARADLDILGLGLEVDRQPVITAVDVPSNLQTIFGGKMNDEAPAAPGLSAIGELTGPGIATPITLAAIPGQKFSLPALHEKGEYSLQNIRLAGENGEFLQQAVPSFAIINVTEVLKTEVRARQLTPQELRERGITVDARNFDVYGRPRQRTYADGTSETWTYDGERVESTKDRQGRTFVYTYNTKGQLSELRNLGSEVLESYGYDAAGRLATWTTRDARLVYENFDMEGRPSRTRQIRYADRSGFGTATVLDEHVQEHEWNVHGERSAWTMPMPANYAVPGWTNRVEEDHDAMGNVIAIRRSRIGSTAMSPLMTADYRNAGRPNVRTLTTTSGAPIVRTYGYDATTSQLNDLKVTSRGLLVAGSGITFDGTQIAKATLHGVSNETRANEYAYDDLSRLAQSRAARISGTSDLAIEQVDKADFRIALERTTTGPAPLPSLSFAQQTGHKIAEMVRGGQSRTFSYGSGAERIDDGRFVYEFDARGRLISATEKAGGSAPQTLRRILYYYSAADRVVGRRAEYAPLASGPVSTWKLEDRPEVLAADALPAEVTFVWDPISDTLVTVAAMNGDPLRQIIQGESGYDDPIEVAVAENNTVHRLHPVFDEAGAGTLQIILNENGEVVSRTVEEGAYGEDEFGLAGAAVDRIAIEAKKDSSGALQSVTISIRTTEQLAAETIATGARLAVVDGNGAVIRSSPTNATLFENYTLRWTLTAEEWTALASSTGNPQRLSIAVTNTLRGAAWDANNGILPAPDWAPSDRMYSSGALPVEYRASLTELASWLGTSSPGEKTLFEATSLSALGGKATPAARLILAAGFQALPFTEPATGLIYARARWYDPSTGTFLSPDPLGYKDSSNLYAFAGGDPVNGRDPTGMQVELEVRPPMRPVVRPPAPGSRPGSLVPETGPPIRPGYAPGDFITLREEIEAAKASRPAGAGTRVFRGRTADELSPAEQADFLKHRSRLQTDPAYRAQWEAMQASTLDLQAELLPMPLPALGGAGGGDDGDDGRGWTVGDPILKLTRSGKTPSWNTQRARFWKNEALKAGAENEYGPENVARMRRGLAPQRYNFVKGGMESMELSHEPVPQREGGTEVVPRWPGAHAAVDQFRTTGYTKAIVRNE